MERTAETMQFLLRHGEQSAEVQGRILIDEEEETLLLQVSMSLGNHPRLLLEVGPVDDRQRLWRLFQSLCEYRGLEFLRWRLRDEREWRDPPTPSLTSA